MAIAEWRGFPALVSLVCVCLWALVRAQRLAEIPEATAVVKSESCSDFTQYLGLQHAAFNTTF